MTVSWQPHDRLSVLLFVFVSPHDYVTLTTAHLNIAQIQTLIPTMKKNVIV